MRSVSTASVLLLASALGGGCALRTSSTPAPSSARHQFTFAWPFVDGDAMAPRGGTSTGAPVVLDDAPGDAWHRLHERGLSPLERDRRAILAMAGAYRASFDFLEVAGFRPGFTPDRPYQSWGTELVMVLRDEPRFISLQHVLVMSVQRPDGTIDGPFVTKHWRQDWRYEDDTLLVYRGRNTWAREHRRRREVRGTWSQAVFQVDDSPRYEAIGRWRHQGNVSTWQSDVTWRPLPRREFSVRSDYQVLVGTNRHTITPTGWIQQEDNLKLRLDAAGRPLVDEPALAQELGINRYERLRDFDTSAARTYWERTAPLWAEVRDTWEAIARERPQFTLRAAPDQGQLFMPLFEYAERLATGEPFDPAAMRTFVEQTVRGYLTDAPPAAAVGYRGASY